MKKTVLVLVGLIISINLFSQWVYKPIGDGTFKTSYTETDNYGYLGMECGDSILVKNIIRYDTISVDTISADTVFGYMYKSYITETALGLKINDYSIIRKDSTFFADMVTASTKNCIILSDLLYNNEFYKVMDIDYDIDYIIDTVISSTHKYIKRPLLYLTGSYFCDNETTIDITFFVDDVKKKYNLHAYKSKNSKTYFFNYHYMRSEEFITDFKNATECSIRVNQSYCSSDYYTFNFSGSTLYMDRRVYYRF